MLKEITNGADCYCDPLQYVAGFDARVGGSVIAKNATYSWLVGWIEADLKLAEPESDGTAASTEKSGGHADRWSVLFDIGGNATAKRMPFNLQESHLWQRFLLEALRGFDVGGKAIEGDTGVF